MKIAFTSCMDAVDDRIQPVWNRIREEQPDLLMLVGDAVYMDFGPAVLGSKRPLGWPRKASNQIFAETLYERYLHQWEVASFQKLLETGLKVTTTWDDHDFAWNGSRGASTEKRRAVSLEKRIISRALALQFRNALNSGSVKYPPMPAMAALLETEDLGIQESIDIDNVRIVMLDGRSFREDPNDVADAEMHGRAQREWLGGLLQSWGGPKVIGSGSVMTRSGESWDQYVDYAWLLDQPSTKTIVLTGDIHKNVLPVRHSKQLYEITASGAARPPFKGFAGGMENFGILSIQEEITATLYSQEIPAGIRVPLSF
jgi:alkaline phosphatase D